VEDKPSATRSEVRRQIGKLEEEDSVNVMAPTPVLKKGRRAPGTVGLRAVPPGRRKEVSETAVAARTESRQRVREARDEHRQRVWDKLDEARRRADEKRPRIDKFRPTRDGED
jgi:hypothetical protein